MKTKISTLLIASLLFSFLSCQKNQIKSESYNTTNTTIRPINKLDKSSQISLSSEMNNLLLTTKNVLLKIADSDLSLEEIATFKEEDFIAHKIFTQNELKSFSTVLSENGNSIKRKLNLKGDETCLSCNTSYQEKMLKISYVIKNIRLDKNKFNSDFNSYLNQVKANSGTVTPLIIAPPEDEGPDCSFAFYVCTGLCSGATSGIGAVACVYICACSYCKVTPPGC